MLNVSKNDIFVARLLVKFSRFTILESVKFVVVSYHTFLKLFKSLIELLILKISINKDPKELDRFNISLSTYVIFDFNNNLSSIQLLL